MEKNKTFMFEATVGDVRLHNSKLDDNSWVDLYLRVAGEVGIEAAMLLHRAKNKMVKITFEQENE